MNQRDKARVLLVAMNQLIYKQDSMGSDADIAIANVLSEIANEIITKIDDDELEDMFINIALEFDEREIDRDVEKVRELFSMIQDS